ncbi:hypothetical protein E4T66_19870 [Sinimarinibacterium sp. CAU 1509]|uniref:hypothetical protein n=1 Tax=Sinimarinibacterium sp. CAU 1509 TaxID=2562283 RepID=UPI0010ABC137|nr:hypothetical protein [Sinimarinibacterium sp. CAU 1509]TJY56220.1 hypothetical protein E4T66_19870 [Sinimarinibacterium sp. CAU 1509]
MDAPTSLSTAALPSQDAAHDAGIKPRSEIEALRANFHEHIEARIHDVGTISNLVLTLRQVLHLADSSEVSPRIVARVRAIAAEQLRRFEHGACGCDRCLSASTQTLPSAIRVL